MTSEELTSKGVDLWSSQKKDEEVLSKIYLIKKKIEEKPINQWTTDGLVDHIFTLCKIMDNLSELKDNAILHSDACENVYDSQVREHYLSFKAAEKYSDVMAKTLAEQKCDELKNETLLAKHYSRLLVDLYKDCDRLISFTQTHVKATLDSKVRANIERA